MITSDLLRTLALFSTLDDACLEEVAHSAADIRLNAGEYLLEEGDAAAFFVLVEGEIAVTKLVGGAAAHLDTYHPGDSFGEVPLLLGSVSTATLQALTPLRVLRLEALEFMSLLSRSDALAASVMKNMTRRVGNLRNAVLQTSQSVLLLIGEAADVECSGLREFLARNQVPYRWLQPEEEAHTALIAQHVSGQTLPVVVLPDGEILPQPSMRELAVRVGLSVTPQRPEYDVVILGGGPAGLAAAVYGASEGLCTLLVEKQAPGGQAGTSSRIENYLGFPTGVSGDDLSARALRQARRFGAEVITTRQATRLQPHPEHGGYCVTLDGGDQVQARSVVLATGVEWRTLPLPGASRLTGRGVWYGAARSEAAATRGKHVYLIGGGNSAGQAAMYFSSYAETVTLLIRADQIEKSMSQYLIEQLRGKQNVSVCLNCQVTELHGDTQLSAITVRDSRDGHERTLETDALFVFIGADARTDWLPDTVKRDEHGYLCTGLDLLAAGGWTPERDPFLLETSLPGVFAVGDVRRGSIKRVASGVGEGSMSIALIHQYLALRPPTA
ncbi:FAD-dependent oxidoreductase [Deinococcus ruber]|uniref:Cyclic nucleotide-binding domain-containing protein n=1 Tax=Deinococcus ruber TaxID=1848197 RepID=A0A918F5B8_9DEIO|nr:cyclic nucleotide-binding domain-containing thioredoxin-disulfide reductase [Deinococcus ruber]GGR05930.1 hypothetical protein GCM10008957_18360 [Deinococcus ruber]